MVTQGPLHVLIAGGGLSVAAGTVFPPAGEWTGGTPAMLRDAMLAAIDGWHPALRGIVERTDLDSIFVIPFGYLDPAPAWTPSRVTLIGDAADAMLPTLGMVATPRVCGEAR